MFSINKIKMMIDKRFVLVFLVIGVLSLPLLAQSRMTWYSFEITVPDEVNANPGDTVEVEGEILVTGMYWLHMFEMTVDGLPYEYEMEPGWGEHVRILRDWNPEVGVFRVPETFKLTIQVPEDAVGAHLVTITGQEHHSFREISNETYFILTVGGVVGEADLGISDILVPETIKEYEPFSLTFKIDNDGALDAAATISVIIPEDWEVDESSHTLSVEAYSSEVGRFEIIPTTTAGEISLLVEYPFKEEIINFTKVGPYLIPTGELPPTTTTTKAQPFYAPVANFVYALGSPVIKLFEQALGDYTVPVTIGIIIVLLVIIFWLISGIFSLIRVKDRSEPETIKSQPEQGTTDLGGTDFGTTTLGTDGVQLKEV